MSDQRGNGPWITEYRRGRADYEAGRIDERMHRYDGPYRLGYFEASQGMSDERAEQIGREV